MKAFSYEISSVVPVPAIALSVVVEGPVTLRGLEVRDIHMTILDESFSGIISFRAKGEAMGRPVDRQVVGSFDGSMVYHTIAERGRNSRVQALWYAGEALDEVFFKGDIAF